MAKSVYCLLNICFLTFKLQFSWNAVFAHTQLTARYLDERSLHCLYEIVSFISCITLNVFGCAVKSRHMHRICVFWQSCFWTTKHYITIQIRFSFIFCVNWIGLVITLLAISPRFENKHLLVNCSGTAFIVKFCI